MHQMYLEIEQLRARNDKLAAALGACHLCFGDDLSCPECTGRGRPGGAMPDRVLFAALVTPAVRRLSEPNRYRPDRGPRLGDLSPQRFPMEEEAPPNVFD
jgi:hypothetical protein